MALRQYADDNCGYIPPMSKYHFSSEANWCGTQETFGGTWLHEGLIWPYVRSRETFLCPSDLAREAEGLDDNLVPSKAERKKYPLSYSMNGELHKWNSSNGKWEILKIDALPRGKPTKVMLLIHESRKTINDGLYLWRNNDCDVPDDIHNDGTTLSFCDGHARRISKVELLRRHHSPSEWDPDPTR